MGTFDYIKIPKSLLTNNSQDTELITFQTKAFSCRFDEFIIEDNKLHQLFTKTLSPTEEKISKAMLPFTGSIRIITDKGKLQEYYIEFDEGSVTSITPTQ